MEEGLPVRERKRKPLLESFQESSNIQTRQAIQTRRTEAIETEPDFTVELETSDNGGEESASNMARGDVKEHIQDDLIEPRDDGQEDDDPIVAEFQVFIKPQMMNGRQFYVLQYPTRDKHKPYNAEHGSAPLELRVKPKAGMVEVDVPLDVHQNYDRGKGIKWGEALKKSEMTKGGGSHGLPGGFGIGGAAPSGRGRGRGEAEEAEHQERLLSNYDRAVEDGHVLKKQTLGGQFLPKTDASPVYMVGTFVSDQLHLTPVDQIIPLRPQFHHIDAQAEQDRLVRARDAGAGRVTEARALHMSVKSTIDGEENNATSMSDRVAAVQAEHWQRHEVIDGDKPEAWQVFQESLFVGGSMTQKTEDLIANVPKLISGVSDEDYLDMISAPRDKDRLAKIRAAKVSRKARKEKKNGKGKETAVDVHDSSSTLSDISSDSESDEEATEVSKDNA